MWRDMKRWGERALGNKSNAKKNEWCWATKFSTQFNIWTSIKPSYPHQRNRFSLEIGLVHRRYQYEYYVRERHEGPYNMYKSILFLRILVENLELLNFKKSLSIFVAVWTCIDYFRHSHKLPLDINWYKAYQCIHFPFIIIFLFKPW